MSKATDSKNANSENIPLFARLLQSSELQAGGGGRPAPTYHCLDMECTKKYPSDDDEVTSTLWDK
jgi:hypothetical protein